MHGAPSSLKKKMSALAASSALVSLLGLAAEIGEYGFGAPEKLVELFSLSYEANVPTWYATVLLFSCAATLAGHANAADLDRPRWWLLAAAFAYISLDEAIEIHEHAGFFETHGVLYFSWIIPAAGVVLGLGLFYLPFLRRLPPPTRVRFVVAGVVFVAGALGMELPLGWWTEAHGDDTLGYGLIDWVEETLELIGASLFLRALWLYPGASPEPEDHGSADAA